jgi:hypothetical protein
MGSLEREAVIVSDGLEWVKLRWEYGCSVIAFYGFDQLLEVRSGCQSRQCFCPDKPRQDRLMRLDVRYSFDPNPDMMGDFGAGKFVIAVDAQKCGAFTCEAQHETPKFSLETKISVGHSTTDWHDLEQLARIGF